MKKQIAIFLLIIIPLCGFSQNKKEQIERLNMRVDSCKTIISTLEIKNRDLNNLNDSLKNHNNDLNKMLNFLKQNNLSMNQKLKVEENRNQELMEIQKRYSWTGHWKREGYFDGSSLEITSQNENMIRFSIDAIDGGHMGFLEGYAVINQNTAIYVEQSSGEEFNESENIVVLFTLNGDTTITIKEMSMYNGAGFGVSYNGDYTRGDSKDTLNEYVPNGRKIFNNESQETIFKELVGNYYIDFLNTTQVKETATDIDGFKATVHYFAVKHMYTLMESIIIIDSSNKIWAAVIDGENLYYFTNSQKHKKSLPKTINKWRSDFSDYPIIYSP